MALDSSNAFFGLTGRVAYAPIGTALPTTYEASLDAAFEEVGYLDPTGLVETNTETYNSFYGWQNSDVLRKVRTQQDNTFDMVFAERNETVLSLFYGADKVGDIRDVTGAATPDLSWVFDVIDTVADRAFRRVVPRAGLTGRGSVSYSAEAQALYPVTLTAYFDATLETKFRDIDPAA